MFAIDIEVRQQCGGRLRVIASQVATLHGATHQAVMEFQVVTNKQLPKVRAGRSQIDSYYRKDMDAVRAGLEKHKTKTGTMNLSGPELTAFDLVRYPHAAVGLHHIATVLTDLGARLDADKLAILSGAFERSVRQRLGFLLGWSGHGLKAQALHARLAKGPPLPWIELEPSLAAGPDLAPLVVERSGRWHVIGRLESEADSLPEAAMLSAAKSGVTPINGLSGTRFDPATWG